MKTEVSEGRPTSIFLAGLHAVSVTSKWQSRPPCPVKAKNAIIDSRASLTVRITVKNGNPSEAGKIWENRFCTGSSNNLNFLRKSNVFIFCLFVDKVIY